MIFQHGVQYDACDAVVGKQLPAQHSNQLGAQALFLPVALTDFNSDFSRVWILMPIAHFPDGGILTLKNQAMGGVIGI